MRNRRPVFSVSRDAYARFQAAARERGIPIAGLVEQALASPAAWRVDGVRSTSEVQAEIIHARAGLAERYFERAARDAAIALAAGVSTHVALEQRCSLDVSECVIDLVDDRLARLREIDGVAMSRAELFDRVVNSVLDQVSR